MPLVLGEPIFSSPKNPTTGLLWAEIENLPQLFDLETITPLWNKIIAPQGDLPILRVQWNSSDNQDYLYLETSQYILFIHSHYITTLEEFHKCRAWWEEWEKHLKSVSVRPTHHFGHPS